MENFDQALIVDMPMKFALGAGMFAPLPISDQPVLVLPNVDPGLVPPEGLNLDMLMPELEAPLVGLADAGETDAAMPGILLGPATSTADDLHLSVQSAPDEGVGLDGPAFVPPADGEEPGGGDDGQDAIIVIGKRPGRNEHNYTMWWASAPDGQGDPYQPGTGGSIQNRATPLWALGTVPEVEVEVLHLDNAAAVKAQADKLIETIIGMNVAVDQLRDLDTVTLADNTTMSGLDFKKLWATIDFKVTDATFASGRGGAYNSETRVTTFNHTQLGGWVNSDPNGAAFIMLHEVIHSSPQGVAEDAEQWLIYWGQNPEDEDGSEYFKSHEFEENEEFANVGALALADILGVKPRDGYDPTNGYEYGSPDNDPDPLS